MEKILPTGAKLVITRSEFELSLALNDALLVHLKELPIGPGFEERDFSVLQKPIIEAVTDPIVKKALFACFERCSYNNVKLNMALFDDPAQGDSARKDYYAIIWEVVKANCASFFELISSWLKTQLPSAVPVPK